jgi:predicted nucleic acid-binding protein
VKSGFLKLSRTSCKKGDIDDYSWLNIVNPKSAPSEWLALDLGMGEIAAMALALENPDKVILLDDALARRIAQAAGLQVWGTLKILLEAKSQKIINNVKPYIPKLRDSGMWISAEVEKRILRLADES